MTTGEPDQGRRKKSDPARALWREELGARLQPLRLRPEREAEIVEELSQHLDDRVRELVAGGVTPEAARQSAIADLDAPGELARRLAAIEARSPYHLAPPGMPARGRWLTAFWQDVRYSIRALRRTPAFTLTVIAALALTIGPTTAILSVGNWLLWRPAPGVAQTDRLAVVYFGEWQDDGGVSPRSVSELNLKDLRSASRTLADIAGWQESTVSFAAEGSPPRRAGSAHASANFFDVLGIRVAAGRMFTVEEDLPPYGSPVAVISDSLARGVFGSETDALGRSFSMNGRPMSVIGVTPPGFAGATPFSQVDIWYPSATYFYVNHFGPTSVRFLGGRDRGIFYTFVARLAPAAAFDALQAELDVLVPAFAERYPDENKAFHTVRARVYPGLGPNPLQREQFRGLMRSLLMVGGVLLLLGCANVANLLISRGVRRQHERAVRVALGASRRRLVQLLLTESCLLALAGSALGVGIAVWLKELIQALLLPGAAGAGVDLVVPMDARVLGATLGVSIACGLTAGLAPAWIGSSSRPSGDLGRGDLRTSTGGSRLRAGFAVTQLALSLALVTNAILLVATLRNLAAVDVGFDARGVSIHYLDLGSHGYDPDRSMAYNRELLERLSAEPALEAVSLSSNHPFGSGFLVSLHDPAGSDDARLRVYTNGVTDGYFHLLRIPLLAGRVFAPAETMRSFGPDGSPVILDEVLARRLFGDANPLGRAIRPARTLSTVAHDLVVIGVARNARWGGLTREPDLLMYVPFAYAKDSTRPVVMVKSGRPLREVGELVQAKASAIDPSLPLSASRPLTASIERELATRRVLAWVLSLLGALAFVLAAVGLYALLAQMVGERTREFGIRMAIGADRRHVFGLVLRQATWIAILGSAAGIGLAVMGSRLVATQLFGLSPIDPWVYIASAASLATVVLAAAVWPARAATRIEPIEALRME